MAVITFPAHTRIVDLSTWAARKGKRLRYVTDERFLRNARDNLQKFVIEASQPKECA